MRWRGASAGLAVALCLLVASAIAATASARKLNVHPGKNAIRKAINRADDGDKLRIHKGRYRGPVEVTKALKLVGVGKGRPVIDGRCKTNITLDVQANGVVLRDLKVVGANEGFGPFPSEILYRGIASGRAQELLVKDTCDAEYGINVFQSGHVTLTDNNGKGFSDAAYYVGGITDTAGQPLRVTRSEAEGNNRAVIVEDSAGGDIRIEKNAFQDNTAPGEHTPAGIFITNSDGVLVRENALRRNGIGIHLDSDSDNNALVRNAAEEQTPDLLNEGSGNCGSENAFALVGGNPLVPC